MKTPKRTSELVSRAGGATLAAVVSGIAAVRPAAKPLHPLGVTRTGSLTRRGATPATGSAWLDAAGTDPVRVRLSRAVGTPPGWPDVHGLALSVDTAGGRGDLLFATTGWRGVARFLLTVHRSAGHAMTTLLPYRTARGPLLLGLTPVDERHWTMVVARPLGPWRPVADLELDEGAGEPGETGGDFDPVRWRLPGLEQYAAVERLREPAYRTARRSRGDA